MKVKMLELRRADLKGAGILGFCGTGFLFGGEIVKLLSSDGVA